MLITGDGRVKLADFGLARVFQAPPRPLFDDNTVVTRLYRAPELILGSRHYTPAVDVWALGAVFGELLRSTYLFFGGDEDDNVAKLQLLKIFHSLGKPDSSVWPTLTEMPRWGEVEAWSEMASCVPHAEGTKQMRETLVNRMQFASSRGGRANSAAECNAAVTVMLEMLDYDPMRRVSCKMAKKSPFFAGTPEAVLRGNVLAESGGHWQSFYKAKEECHCTKCTAA